MQMGCTTAESKGLLRNRIKHVKSMLADETRVNKYIDEQIKVIKVNRAAVSSKSR
jgi:hypothetical protein